MPDLLPVGSTLQVVSSVKELGTAFRFGSKPEVARRDARVAEATARLHRIKAMGRGVRESAQLIQRSAWPAILHGLEGHLLPLTTLSKLRGLASRAMVGHHAALSPHLALCAITTLVQDPPLYCLLRQLHLLRRTFRRDPGLFFSVLKLASLPPLKHVMGPGTAIAGALGRLGASVDEGGILKFADNGRVAGRSSHQGMVLMCPRYCEISHRLGDCWPSLRQCDTFCVPAAEWLRGGGVFPSGMWGVRLWGGQGQVGR